MRHFGKRAFALLLSLMLCLSLFPSAMAEDAGSIAAADEKEQEGSIAPAEEVDALPRTDEIQDGETSGRCGENLSWCFDEATGILTIAGSGDMWDWSYNAPAPWYSLCDSIKSVKLPSGLTGIGNYAFSNCSEMTEVEIPAGVISIGNNAFSRCSSLTAIDIPVGMTSIGAAAFNSSGLASVTIPEGVTSIGHHAFYECSSLKSVTLPGSLQETGSYLFPDVLTDISYMGTIACWQQLAVEYDHYAVTVHCSDGDLGPADPMDCGYNLVWSLNRSGTLTISGTGDMWNFQAGSAPWHESAGSVSSLRILSGVTGIGNYAFYGCTGLVGTVSIPEGVTRIGDGAFYYCNDAGTSDLSILLPESLRTIGRDAFHACWAARISIPGGIQKDGGAFWGITSAMRIDFGGTRQAWLELDPEYDFYFSSVFCTDGTIERKNIAFCGDDLTWDLDNSGLLTVSGTGDMWDFINMDGHGYTFSTAPWSGVSPAISLRKVLLPSGLTHLGNLAFYGNSGSLSAIRFTGPAPSFGESAFFGVSATVYYPANDPSWTGEVRQSYRGRIAWVGYVPGDANGDGTPDLLDLVRLRKELAGLSPELDITAADLSGNWEIDAQDLVLLRKLLVGEAS